MMRFPARWTRGLGVALVSTFLVVGGVFAADGFRTGAVAPSGASSAPSDELDLETADPNDDAQSDGEFEAVEPSESPDAAEPSESPESAKPSKAPKAEHADKSPSASAKAHKTAEPNDENDDDQGDADDGDHEDADDGAEHDGAEHDGGHDDGDKADDHGGQSGNDDGGNDD